MMTATTPMTARTMALWFSDEDGADEEAERGLDAVEAVLDAADALLDGADAPGDGRVRAERAEVALLPARVAAPQKKRRKRDAGARTRATRTWSSRRIASASGERSARAASSVRRSSSDARGNGGRDRVPPVPLSHDPSCTCPRTVCAHGRTPTDRVPRTFES